MLEWDSILYEYSLVYLGGSNNILGRSNILSCLSIPNLYANSF